MTRWKTHFDYLNFPSTWRDIYFTPFENYSIERQTPLSLFCLSSSQCCVTFIPVSLTTIFLCCQWKNRTAHQKMDFLLSTYERERSVMRFKRQQPSVEVELFEYVKSKKVLNFPPHFAAAGRPRSFRPNTENKNIKLNWIEFSVRQATTTKLSGKRGKFFFVY